VSERPVILHFIPSEVAAPIQPNNALKWT